MRSPLDTLSRPRFANHPLDIGDGASIPPGDTPAAIWPHDTDALITVIETRFHAVHRRDLPDLVRLARQVEASHKAHPAAPPGLADLLQRIEWDLEAHMQKEEQGLFPSMRHDEPPAPAAIALMLDDHEEHAANLQRLVWLTGDFSIPENACPTWRALYAGARKLAGDLVEHIRIENDVLFPRFAAQPVPGP